MSEGECDSASKPPIPQEDDGELSFDWDKIKERVFNPASEGDLIDAYDDWSAHYDVHLKELEYTAPKTAARTLDRYLMPRKGKGISKKGFKILDAGCGTGLVGKEMHLMGYARVDGLDASAKMLAKARSTGFYGDTFEEFLGKPHVLSMNTSTYDAIICVGTFTISHVKVDALDEMIRVTKVGGLLVFTIRGVYEEFEPRLNELFRAGVLEKIQHQSIFGQTRKRCKMELFAVRVLKHLD